MSDIDKMTDAELSKAISEELFNSAYGTRGYWVNGKPGMVALLEWLTKHTYEVFINRKDDGVYIVRVLMPKDCEPVYTHADTIPRAVAEAALRVAREVKP